MLGAPASSCQNEGNERRGAPAGHRGRRSQAQVLEELLSSSARATGTDGAGGDAGRQAAQLHRAPATRRLGTGLGEGLAEEVEAGTEARQGRTLARHSQIRRRRLRWLAGGAEATRRRPQVREEAALVGGSRDLAGGAARCRRGPSEAAPWRGDGVGGGRAGLPEVGDGGEHGGESPEQDGDGRFKAKVAESGEELDRSGGLAVVGDARARRRSKRATSGLAAATGARAPASSGQNDGEERRGCQRARALVQRGEGDSGLLLELVVSGDRRPTRRDREAREEEGARGRRSRGDEDRAMSVWRRAEGTRGGDGIEQSSPLRLGLGGAAGPWEAGPVEKEVARGLAGQLGWALSLSLISIRKEIERGKEREG